jgi:hypothetical protein
MVNLVECIIGVALIYLGLSRFAPAGQKKGFLFGLVAIAGLILVVHGILLFLVPDFFKPSV